MASRVASSLLRAANLDELIVSTLDEYEELAVALATDLDKLYLLRRRLEDGRLSCPLFDTQRWVRNLETGLVMAWDRHEAGLAPEHIDVPDVMDEAAGDAPREKKAAIGAAPGSGASTSSALPMSALLSSTKRP